MTSQASINVYNEIAYRNNAIFTHYLKEKIMPAAKKAKKKAKKK
jgi:hypothetical protein